MLERLAISHGLDETVIKWLESYLRGRTQRVMIDKFKSDPIKVEDGAVQGSKIGCRLYKKYVQPLGKLLKSSECSNHGYADDNKLTLSVKPVCDREYIRLNIR